MIVQCSRGYWNLNLASQGKLQNPSSFSISISLFGSFSSFYCSSSALPFFALFQDAFHEGDNVRINITHLGIANQLFAAQLFVVQPLFATFLSSPVRRLSPSLEAYRISHAHPFLRPPILQMPPHPSTPIPPSTHSHTSLALLNMSSTPFSPLVVSPWRRLKASISMWRKYV